MPIKVYSNEQKEEVRIQLLETGLSLYSQNGIRKVKLIDILRIVGISKPFFYTFYTSSADFVLSVLEYQWQKFPAFIEKYESRTDLVWEDKIYDLLINLVDYNKNGFLIMTQAEETWLYQRVDYQRYKTFMGRQSVFFNDLLVNWGISNKMCNPKVLSNMVIAMIITHNSSKESLPFMFLEDLDETAKQQAKSIVLYLKSLKESR